jgi:hypothetical protein
VPVGEHDLAAIVDRDAGEHVLELAVTGTQVGLHPAIAALLEVGEEDGVVDVAEAVQVAPADLDALLAGRHAGIMVAVGSSAR